MNIPQRVLLVDDERPARKWMRQLLLAHPEVEVIGEADSVAAAAHLAAHMRPDVIFLDIQMAPSSGFDLLPLLDPLPRIIFVTAHDTYAVRAFEACAFDYLLKPVPPDRLAQSIRRLCSTATNPLRGDWPQGMLQLGDLVPLRDRGVMRMVRVETIAAVCAEGAYSRILLEGAPAMLVLQRIGEWERRLPTPPFRRLDRSLLVNMQAIREVNRRSRDETFVVLDGQLQPLSIGRQAGLRLRKALSARGGSKTKSQCRMTLN